MIKENLSRISKIFPVFLLILFSILLASCGNDSKNYSVKDYQKFLSALNDDDFYSITSAVDEYKNHFEKSPNQKNDSAFVEIRKYYYEVINTGNVKFWQNEEFQTQFYEDSSAYSKMAKKFLDSLSGNGLKLSASEGLFYIDENPKFLYNNFSKYLSSSLSDYLKLRRNELKEGFADDAELIITFDQLGERIIAWENYNEKHPNSLLKEEAKFNYELYLNTFFTGMDNSSLWDENERLTDEMKNNYNSFIKKRMGRPSGKLVQKFFSFLEKRDFKYSDDVFKFYDENLPDIMFGDQTPIN